MRHKFRNKGNGSSIGTFFSFASTISAFGLDVSRHDAGTIAIGGSVSDSISLAAMIPQFWGVIEFGGITSISFNASGSPLAVGFDAASFGQAAVPEPATMLLLGAGLVGLAGFRRKFKK